LLIEVQFDPVLDDIDVGALWWQRLAEFVDALADLASSNAP